jgi:undecaprenyl-diphosphatase
MLEIRNQLDQHEFKKRIPLLLALLVVFWTPVIIFLKISGEIIEREPIYLDNSILFWIHSQATATYDHIFFVITTMGNVEFLGPFTLLVVGLFWYKKQHLNALIVFTSVAGAAIANVVLKLLFHRDRPVLWQSMIHETGYSFPSGHAMLSTALLLSLIFIAWNTKARWWALAGGIVLICLVGISRLYMGVHYPTDIVAGWCASSLWVSVVFAVVHRFSYRVEQTKSLP